MCFLPSPFSRSMQARAARLSVHDRQHGFTLIELMISLVIGLLVMAAATAIFINSGRTSKVAEVNTRLNEDGLLALNVIQQQLRAAGYSQRVKNVADDATDARPYMGVALRGCSDGFAGASKEKAGFDSISCTLGTSAGDLTSSLSAKSDSVAIRYEADVYNTIASGTAPTNCLGAAITSDTPSAAAAGVNYPLADNRLYVSNGSLYCAGSAGNAKGIGTGQPLFGNVEQLSLRYGVVAVPSLQQRSAFDANHGQIVNYLTASQVDSLPNSASPLPSARDEQWGRVVSVRVCMVLKSSEKVMDAVIPATYKDCNNTAQNDPKDGFLRRAFVTTVMLRNRLVVPNCPKAAATC